MGTPAKVLPCVAALAASVPTIASAPRIESTIPPRFSAVPTAREVPTRWREYSPFRRMRCAKRV